MSECERCGECCRNSGTIWAHSEHPLIKATVAAVIERGQDGFFRDDGPCDMLIIEKSGRAACFLHKWLGWAAKPAACRDYPFDGEKCFREKDGQ